MSKTILITGSTDGIGREAAKTLAALGHTVLLHGRSADKLAAARKEITAAAGGDAPARIDGFTADLSDLDAVEALARAVTERHPKLDVLINNAGVFATRQPTTSDGRDVRFVVNTVAPYLLTRRLLPSLPANGRIVNLSSAAQAPVDLRALAGGSALPDQQAYAQSKLAITMWSRHLAHELGDGGPAVIAVNPGSLLATKMVKEAYGIAGSDVQIGADILRRASLDADFGAASGSYFDNDSGQFAPPHPDAQNDRKCEEIVSTIEAILAR